MVAERQEHDATQKALDRLTTWGEDPSTDGGENIIFSPTRQGPPSDTFFVTGDCTPFTSSGKRNSDRSGVWIGHAGRLLYKSWRQLDGAESDTVHLLRRSEQGRGDHQWCFSKLAVHFGFHR